MYNSNNSTTMDCFGDSSSDDDQEECLSSERDASCGVFSFHSNTEVGSLPGFGVSLCSDTLSPNLHLATGHDLTASLRFRRRCLCM